jgi:hypothetical protein
MIDGGIDMTRKIKLTPKLLKKIVLEEKRKLVETLEQGKEDPEKVSADEVGADELASTLEKDIDFLAALKIKESKLRKQYRAIKATRKKILERVTRRNNKR